MTKKEIRRELEKIEMAKAEYLTAKMNEEPEEVVKALADRFHQMDTDLCKRLSRQEEQKMTGYKMTTTQAFQKCGFTILVTDDRYIWRVEYKGKEYTIQECDGRVDWTPRYHITDNQTGEKVCTRANFRTAIQRIKAR